MRTVLVVATAFLMACASAQQGPIPPDARTTTTDPVGTPDAVAAAPDANASADAAQALDALAGNDAPPAPDAPSTPDAAAPDAATPDATPQPDACIPGPELCNGMDDNCNGVKDEGFVQGTACTSGMGECLKAGKTVCSDDGTKVVCDAVPGTATAIDLCDNNKDDDCDGKIDEDFPLFGKLCNAGVGSCKMFGVNVCNADLDDIECDAVPGTPGTELCGNEMDDDCDGETDEGFTQIGQQCSVGMGECKAIGVMVCNPQNRTMVMCGAIPGDPEPELCNGKDDNCDGMDDEGNPGGGGACTTPNPGVCGPGHALCVEGQLACAPDNLPDSELCNGLDDDCDGLVDDGYRIGEPCDDDRPDFCKNGEWQCATELTAECAGDTVISETCNTLDDDCDGDVDENFDLLSNPNTCGSCTTVCSSNGVETRRCTGGSCDPDCAYGRQSCDGNLTNGCEANRNTDPAWPDSYIPERISGDVDWATVTKTGYAEARYKVRVEEQDDFWDNQWVAFKLTNRDGVNMDLCAHCNGNVVCSEGSGRTDTVYVFADETPWPLPGNDDSFTAYVEVIYSNSERSACNFGATADWTLLIDSEADNPPGGAIVIDCD